MCEYLFKESNLIMLRRRRREAWSFWLPVIGWGAVFAFAVGCGFN